MLSSQGAGGLDCTDLRYGWKGLGPWYEVKTVALDKLPQKVIDGERLQPQKARV